MATATKTPRPRAARGMGPRSGIRTLFVWKSRNGKTGGTAATYRTQGTCPVECPLRTITEDETAETGQDARDGGCYAEHGFPAAFTHAARGAEGGSGIPEDAAERLRHGTAVRFNVSGDFLGADGLPDHPYIRAADELIAARPEGCTECAEEGARPHLVGIAYTHAWRAMGPRDGVFATVAPRASCETPADVLAARASGWAAVITVPEDDPEGLIGTVRDGVRYAPCPAQLPARLECADCRACARRDPNGPVIVFRAHGAARKRILPVVGETSTRNEEGTAR